MAKFLGIDLGTSKVKCVVIDESGKVVAHAATDYPIVFPRPGWVEQDPEVWWQAVRENVNRCLKYLPEGAGEIEAIGLSGNMSGLVLLDGSGQPLRPCILLADTRSVAQSAKLAERLGSEIFAATGNPAVDAFVAPKLLWIKENEENVYRRAATFVFPKDFIRFRLTGEIATEATDAGNTLFLRPASNGESWEWSEELLSALGLNECLLPPLVPTTAVVGQVSQAAAKETGLQEGTPVVAGGADMACSAIGTGAVEFGVVAVTIGTAAQAVTRVPEPLPAGYGKVTFHPHAIPGAMYAMGSIFTGGLGMRWLADAISEIGMPSLTPAKLSDKAADLPVGSGGLVFLPFLVGGGTPHFNPEARGVWLGLTGGTRLAHLARSVMEGVAFNIKDSLRVFKAMGVHIGRINVGGGGASSSVWQQILADVFGQPIYPVRVRDAAAVGAAILAGIGVGILPGVEIASRQIVNVGEAIEPREKAVDAYRGLYEIYEEAYGALQGLFSRLARFTAK